jgi:predicted DNA-binding protein with PD1-like motif
MIYSFDGFNYLIRLDKGERLKECIERFVRETKLDGAWVNGLGVATEATLGFYDPGKKAYAWQTFEGLREVLNLTGNIAFDDKGELVLHLHGVLGDREYQTVGGHVKDLVAGATLELFVHRAYQPTKRRHDEATGLPLLELAP